MSRGKVDYRVYRIKPQLNMRWPKAIQFMLQSPENIVASKARPNQWRGHLRTLYRIRDGVLEYRWEGWSEDERWGQAAQIQPDQPPLFDAVATDLPPPRDCERHEDEPIISDSDELDARLERIEQQIATLRQSKRKG